MHNALETMSYPYKLPKWISAFFVLLIPIALAGIYHQASTTGFKTRSGAPVNPAVIWFFISVLLLTWLASARMLQLSFHSGMRLSLTADGVSMPRHALTSNLINLPYTQIQSVSPHALKPDILIVKTANPHKTYTIQRVSLPSRAAFEQVQAELVLRLR
jgi:hypothetical protein